MHVIFIEPRFPGNQKLFVRALAESESDEQRAERYA